MKCISGNAPTSIYPKDKIFCGISHWSVYTKHKILCSASYMFKLMLSSATLNDAASMFIARIFEYFDHVSLKGV